MKGVYSVKGRPGWYDVEISLGYSDEGKQIRQKKRVFVGNEAAALRFKLDWEKDIGKHQRSVKTVLEIWEIYRKHISANRENSPVTIADKERVFVKDILPNFGNELPDFITTSRLEDYQTKRLSETKKGEIHRQINLELMYFRTMIKWAKSKGLCVDELAKVKNLKYEKNKQPDTLSSSEANEIIDSIPGFFHRAMFTSIYHAGLRKKEVSMLRKEDIDFREGMLNLVMTKGEKPRSVPMTNTLCVYLCVHLMLLNGEGIEYDHIYKRIHGLRDRGLLDETLVFPSYRTGKAMTDLRFPLKQAKETLNISKRLYNHLFRHSFASHLVDNDANIKTVQELLGHSSITTTMIYVHPSDKTKADAIKRAFGGR